MSQSIDDCLWIKNIATLNVNGVDYRFTLWGVNKNEAANILINSVLEDKGILSMDLVQIKHLLKELKKVRLEKRISERFILVLMEGSTKSQGKNLLS